MIGCWSPLLGVPTPRSPAPIRAAEVSRAYVDAGLPEEKSKAFHQNLDFKAWGAFLQGGSGKLGAHAEVRRQLQRVTAALLALGWSTKKLVEQILGLYASIFIFRRDFFSLFHHLYTFCSENPYGVWVPILAPYLDEFRAASIHLAFAIVDLRAEPSTRILATDAIPT